MVKMVEMTIYRGTAYYAKELEKMDLPKADKYYLEFNGANSSAKVYVNGKELAIMMVDTLHGE